MLTHTLARPRRTPSSRNLEIYAQVKIRGCRQSDVAEQHRITQSRVSRIVAQVELWRAGEGAALDPLSNTERRRHERWLARERWELIYQRSLFELNASARALTSERSGTRDGKAFRETTRREQATSVQWMKTAIKAAENLVKLSELEPLARPDTDEQRLDEQREAVSNWLIDQRCAAERSGRVAKSGSAQKLVEASLAELIGPDGCDAEDTPPESASERAAKLSAAIRAAEAASAATPPLPNSPFSERHNCHMPAVAMTPADPDVANNESSTNPCAAINSATNSSPQEPTPPPPMPQKNPTDMTPGREPWEDEYERLIEERKTIRLPMGSVVRS